MTGIQGNHDAKPVTEALQNAETIAALVVEKLKRLQPEAPPNPGANITLGKFFRHYIDTYASVHTRSAKIFEQDFRLYLTPWSDRLLTDIRRPDVIELQAELAKTKSKNIANRAVELLRMLYYKAIDWEMFVGNNPAARVKKFTQQSRERFLLPDEIPRFIAAVKALRHQTSTDFFLMLLYTAQRRRNVCEMRWEEIDFERRVWRIPQTKNGTSHNVPLVAQAIEILETRRASNDKHAEWVFPKRDGSGPIWCLDIAWRSVLERAQIENLRIHDLRRSHASWQAISGVNMPIIGATLNHKDPKSTMIYARLYIDPVRDGMQLGVDTMLSAGQPLSREEMGKLHLVPREKRGQLKLVANKPAASIPDPKAMPRNALIKINREQQMRIEAKILAAVSGKPRIKSYFRYMIGGFTVNGRELQRILDEMTERGLLVRFHGEPHWDTWQYASAERADYLAVMNSESDAPAPMALSKQQRAVVDGLVKGMSNSEIAKQMGLTINAVKLYVRIVLKKLSVKCRQDAASIALERGLVSAS